MTHAAERYLGRQAFPQLFGLLLIPGKARDPGSVDRAWADDIDPNLAVFQFVGPCAGEERTAAFVAL
jgi:hypothetical protein